MKKIWWVFVIIIISLSTVRPLMNQGFFSMHDDTQVARVFEMGKALSQGQFPVRMVANLGYSYGYPIYNFYGPLPYYVGGFFVLFGVPPLLATKIMFGVGIILFGVTLGMVAYLLWGKPAGIVAGVYGVLAPYHAVQIYVRGAVGEFWALGFVPLVLSGFYFILHKKMLAGILLGSVGLACVIASHTITGFFTVIFVVIFIFSIISWRLASRLGWANVAVSSLGLVALGLGLSAFFWLPAFSEMKFTSVSGQIGQTADFRNHFVCVSQLWDSVWGFGGSIPGCVDGLSFKLGKVHILGALFGILLWFGRGKKLQTPLIPLLAISTAMLIFLMTKNSVGLWEVVPAFAYIQYPWRLLGYVSIGLSLLAASAFAGNPNGATRLVALLGALLVVVINAKWFKPQYTNTYTSNDYISLSRLRYDTSRISDEYLPQGFIKPSSYKDIPSQSISAPGSTKISKKNDIAVYVHYVVETETPTHVVVNKVNFPGWQYKVNDQIVTPKFSNQLPTVPISPGVSKIEAIFTNTPVRNIANTVSLIAVMLWGGIYVKHKKNIS